MSLVKFVIAFVRTGEQENMFLKDYHIYSYYIQRDSEYC